MPAPIFTPATKASIGDHDENVSYEEVARQVGPETAAQLRQATLAIYSRGRDIARDRGIILADTKFEFGRAEEDGEDGPLILADEVFTPDSSRFWRKDQWEPGRPQTLVRQAAHPGLAGLARVRLGPHRHDAAPAAARRDRGATRAKYLEAYERLTGLAWR